MRNDVKQNRGGEPSVKKDFETERFGVFAPPGLPLAQFLTAQSGFNADKNPDQIAFAAGDRRQTVLRDHEEPVELPSATMEHLIPDSAVEINNKY